MLSANYKYYVLKDSHLSYDFFENEKKKKIKYFLFHENNLPK